MSFTESQKMALKEAAGAWLGCYCGLWKAYGDDKSRPTFTKRTMTSLVHRGLLVPVTNKIPDLRYYITEAALAAVRALVESEAKAMRRGRKKRIVGRLTEGWE